jgi:ferredoxin
MARRLNVVIDRDRCVSNRMCVGAVPGVFRLDAEGNSEVYDVEGDSEEKVIEAGFNCPVGAISVTDADTGADVLDELLA